MSLRVANFNRYMEDVCSSDTLRLMTERLECHKSQLQSRTSRLWLQYMDMVDVLRKFIKGERTGNIKLHLQAVFEMLPYFAASGHSLYVKSAYIHLQTMQNFLNHILIYGDSF